MTVFEMHCLLVLPSLLSLVLLLLTDFPPGGGPYILPPWCLFFYLKTNIVNCMCWVLHFVVSTETVVGLSLACPYVT